jgi:hypothetical protein
MTATRNEGQFFDFVLCHAEPHNAKDVVHKSCDLTKEGCGAVHAQTLIGGLHNARVLMCVLGAYLPFSWDL